MSGTTWQGVGFLVLYDEVDKTNVLLGVFYGRKKKDKLEVFLDKKHVFMDKKKRVQQMGPFVPGAMCQNGEK